MQKKKILLALSLWVLVATPTSAFFKDLDVTHPYYYGIYDLYDNNIIEGYEVDGDRYFRPTQPITRAAALKILMLASKTSLETGENPFPDIKNEWFAPYVLGAHEKGIVNGFNDGFFYPGSNVTRAEFIKMSVLAYRFDIPEKTDDQAWYEPYFDFAKSMNILGEDTLPHKKISRGEVAEIAYRTKKVSENNKPYRFQGFGQASYYGDRFHGNSTASGEKYNKNDLTAAHRTLPFGTRVKVTHLNKSIVVRINDRGPYHKERVMDLSEEAFSRLAPTGAGVISIEFEVFQEKDLQEKPIPEYLRESLTAQTRNPAVPNVVTQKLIETKKQEPRKPYYSKTISSIAKDFYANATLNRSIPQTVYAGSVLSIQGIADRDRLETATVFLAQTVKTNEPQKLFSGKMNGRKFNIPVLFDTPGVYQIGIVFGDDKKSRVERIEVLPRPSGIDWNTERVLVGIDEVSYSIDFESQKLTLLLDKSSTHISKIVLRQQGREQAFYLEQGISKFEIPFEYFLRFIPERDLSIMVYSAQSKDGTLSNQKTYWEAVSVSDFMLTAGFKNKETDKITFFDYRPFLKPQDYTFSGRKHQNVFIRDEVYITSRQQGVRTVPISIDGDRFSFSASLEQGVHIIEIIGEDGTILFNKAVYVSQNEKMLPVYPWQGVVDQYPVNPKRVEVRQWTNSVRKSFGALPVTSNSTLDQFAQSYASKMAREGFLAHTSPDGTTFAQRITAAGIKMDVGENLAFGTSSQLALMGLEDSVSHLQNMIHDKWKTVGIGISQDSDGSYYIVQHFGKE